MKKTTLLFLALTGMFVANAQQTLYTETFESNVAPQWDGYMTTFAPSTKAGTWSGGVNLVTAGDANINLRQGWGNQFNLKILTTGGAAVTIPNINVAGYSNLTLSYDFVMEDAGGYIPADPNVPGSTETPGVDVAPFIEASVDGGANWTTLPTVASGAGWWKQTMSIALPAGTYNAISLRINPNNVTNPNTNIAHDAMFDNLKINETASLGIGSNELTDNSIKVYPNPFVNEFKVDATDSEGPLQVSVFDVLGRKVATAKSSSNQLSMGSSLKSGVYVVKVEGANAKDSKSFKIIKK